MLRLSPYSKLYFKEFGRSEYKQLPPPPLKKDWGLKEHLISQYKLQFSCFYLALGK